MSSCPRDHCTVWDLECPACGAEIDYERLTAGLLSLPPAEPRFEAAEVIFVGVDRAEIPGAFTCGVAAGAHAGRTLEALTLPRVDGGTWGDYLAEAEALRGWLKWTSIGRSRHTLVVMDTTSPLSVLAARSPVTRMAAVLAVTAGPDSTPMEKSASYAALAAISEAGSPTLLATKRYAGDLTLYTPGEGILRGDTAIGHLAARYAARGDDYSRLLGRDKRLGVEAHTLSILPTASDRVYRDPAHALEAAAQIRSAPHGDGDVLSLHLAARGPRGALKRIERAYGALRRRFPALLDSDATLTESEDPKGLYDVAVLYGLRGDPVSPLLRGGYEAVAARTPSLRLEAPP